MGLPAEGEAVRETHQADQTTGQRFGMPARGAAASGVGTFREMQALQTRAQVTPFTEGLP